MKENKKRETIKLPLLQHRNADSVFSGQTGQDHPDRIALFFRSPWQPLYNETTYSLRCLIAYTDQAMNYPP